MLCDLLNHAQLPHLEAELLLAHVLQKDRSWLLAHPEATLTNDQTEKFSALVQRRKDHEPIAYILGEKEFYGRSFSVDKRVLTPRPSTETLIDEVKILFDHQFDLETPRIIEADNGIVIATKIFPERLQNLPLTTYHLPLLLDLGTGSGCIAITLALEIPNVPIIATDISNDALVVAKSNAQKFGVMNRITFMHDNITASRLFDSRLLDYSLPEIRTKNQPPQSSNAPYKPQPPFLIVSNPPYIPEHEPLMPDVSDYEPHEALFADDDGMKILRHIRSLAMNDPACLGCVLECREDQARALDDD